MGCSPDGVVPPWRAAKAAASLPSVTKVVAIGLLCLGTAFGAARAGQVAVRFAEGEAHGFLALRSVGGGLEATGDLFQIARDGHVEKRMVFQFKDGSVFEESVVFTEERVYTLRSYRLVQRGPTFPSDLEISLERGTGKYRVKTKDHKDGRERTIEGTIDLPPDVYNSMILTVVKDLSRGAAETVHYVAFTPEPRLIQLSMTPVGEQRVLVGDLAKTATHYVFKARLGVWLTLFATLLGRVPPDQHVFILSEDVPAFVRFEGPLYPTGPVWRIELTSPSWPD
jgi:hypothetical protein